MSSTLLVCLPLSFLSFFQFFWWQTQKKTPFSFYRGTFFFVEMLFSLEKTGSTPFTFPRRHKALPRILGGPNSGHARKSPVPSQVASKQGLRLHSGKTPL